MTNWETYDIRLTAGDEEAACGDACHMWLELGSEAQRAAPIYSGGLTAAGKTIDPLPVMKLFAQCRGNVAFDRTGCG